MERARSSDLGSQSRRHVGHVRERGMESVSLITRLVVAVSLVLSAIFSVVAAMGFAGRSTTRTSGTSATSGGAGASSSVRIALPPKGGGSSSGITPPVAPPISQPIVQAPPPVTSGGS